ncbi:MAG: aminotransferase class III-fold pyridoxal phosphate-dependent enzyme [Deltaproteobacteria bacterium]|nr:aminotransferase class III-fold pyridoxal phosphate-dependent enzyme [Deltaproteobacteria bacterium]
MKVAAVVQARMSSTRFPRKVVAPLAGVPVAVYILQRLAKAKRVSDVLLATSTSPDDAELAQIVEANGFRVYRGSLEDVLTRFVEAARLASPDVVVRITGDCPLVDPDTLDAMLAHFESAQLDYLSNVSPPTYPDGLDIEICRMSALETALREARPGHQREHVTPFLRENPARFRLGNFTNPAGDESRLRLTIDLPRDLENVAALVAASGVAFPTLADLRRVLSQQRDLAQRCTVTQRNEGAIASYLKDLEAQAPRPKIEKSNALWEKGRALIPAGTQTLSKGPNQFVDGFGPKYLVRGEGSHVWDADGNELIDYPMGLGAVTLGHGRREVVDAVTKQMATGTSFSLMHPLEITLAERITSLVPCAERVRFGKNGSDATSACIRAARAKTGRKHVARCGYHGWQDWSIDASYGIRARGVPEEILALTKPFPYNDLPALDALLSNTPCAAVILEPVAAVEPKPGYLQGVRDLATKHGAVLIFDEVITGFRYARGGAQQYFGVTPDLCSMGKGMANGVPISVVAGTREFMEPFEEIFFSFTFGGETTAIAAALATLDVMEKHDYWAHCWRLGKRVQDGYRALAKEHNLAAITDCAGMPPWTVVTFTDHAPYKSLELKTLFQQEMLRRGILFSGSQFISLSHTDADIDRTLAAYADAMRTLRFALDSNVVAELTLGKVNELVFRRA